MKLSVLFFLNFLFSISLVSQQAYNSYDFRSPLGIPLLLSGNFAELRSNHFHTGIDVKTNGSSGYRIYAVDSGYVSRINISHWGYGKAIYIDHPNGFTSVYGHLSKFSEKIEALIKTAQYKQQSEVVTIYLDSLDMVVSKGEVVALSGNSGSSMGPHLHFELRETVTEQPVNPLLFNFNVKDNIPPLIYNVKFYPFGKSVINKTQTNHLKSVVKSKEGYTLKDKVSAFGEIGLGLHTIDKLNGSNNICGIFSIKLFVNDTLHYFQEMEKLDFSTNRYINTYKDYKEHKKNKRSIHKSFVSENNDLKIYKKLINNGKVIISQNKDYDIKYVVKDVAGNISELAFKIHGDSSQLDFYKPIINKQQLNAVTKQDSLITAQMAAFFPEKSLYQKENIKLISSDYPLAQTSLISIMNQDIPLQKKFILKLKLKDSSIVCNEKAVVVSVSDDLKKVVSKGGTCNDGWMTVNLKSFGNFTVLIDSINPVIKSINLQNGTAIKGLKYLHFKISDNLSGIKSYNVFLDDRWILANYSPKSSNLKVYAKEWEYLKTGNHVCKVKIEDERGNVAVEKIEISY